MAERRPPALARNGQLETRYWKTRNWKLYNVPNDPCLGVSLWSEYA